MKRGINILLVILTILFQSCDKIKKENDITLKNEITEIIDPVIISCFELNRGNSFFNKPLKLNQDFKGKAYLLVSIDTISMKLTNIRIIRADLFTKENSVPYLKFVDTNFSKEPEYPTKLENILPQINKYIDKVEVKRTGITGKCEVNDYQIPLKIE